MTSSILSKPSKTTAEATVLVHGMFVRERLDYHLFGMRMWERSSNSSEYRYSFNGKESDDEVKGEGAQYDYGFRIYDPRIARFLSVDPLTKSYPMLTPYQYASNTPISSSDLDGLESRLEITMRHEDLGIIDGTMTAEEVRANQDARGWGALIGIGIVVTGGGIIEAAPLVGTTLANYATNPAAQFATAEVASFAANLFYDGPDDVFPTPGPGGETAKLFRGLLKSIDTGILIGKKTTILGRYYGGTKELIDRGLNKLKDVNILNIDTNLKGDEFWNKYNKGFLDDAIERGDQIKLTHDPTDLSNLYNKKGEQTMFGREIEYLEGKGYEFNSETMEMVKPVKE